MKTIDKMLDFDKTFYGYHYFVITSEDNLAQIQDKFYGYALIDNKLYIDEIPGKLIKPDTNGAYINIKRMNDLIVIQQDHIGSFGLYYYKCGRYWAISNSLIHIASKIKNRIRIEINIDYVSALLTILCGSLIYKETIYKDIYQLESEKIAIIAIKEKQLLFETIAPRAMQISIDSAAAFALIDNWHAKWNSFINWLCRDNSVIFDLSGGMDTRATLSVLRKLDIDLHSIMFNSIINDTYTYKEDYQIATEIGRILGFSLNEGLEDVGNLPMRVADSIGAWFLARGSFASQFGVVNAGNYHKETVFNICGSAAELVRPYWMEGYWEVVSTLYCLNFPGSRPFLQKTRAIMERNRIALEQYSSEHYPLSRPLLTKARMRNHFGKSFISAYLMNRIMLSPLADPSLQRLEHYSTTDDGNLLFAIIYDRFLPDLANVKFNSGHGINERTLDIAKKLNACYPWKYDYDKYKDFYIFNNRPQPQELAPNSNDGSPAEMLKAYFVSNDLKQWVLKHFGAQMYDYAFNYKKLNTMFLDEFIMQLVTVRFFSHLADAPINVDMQEYDLPAQCDESYYAKEQANEVDDADVALTHYFIKGISQGAATSRLANVSGFQKWLVENSNNRRILICGNAPLVLPNAAHVDYCIAAGETPSADLQRVQFKLPTCAIKHALPGWDISELDDCYDIIYCAPETLERAFCIISFLRNIDRLLGSAGMLCCSLTDCEYSRHYYQPLSTLGEVVERYVYPLKTHELKYRINQQVFMIHNNTALYWQGKHQRYIKYVKNEVDAAIKDANAYFPGDCRHWFFTAHTFYELMHCLYQAKYTPLYIARLYRAAWGNNIFNAILV